MKNCTINVTSADTNDDEMPPLGTGGNVGLFRMRSGEASEGMRSWMSTAMGPSWFRLVQLPSIIKPLDWLSAGTQEISKPQFSPQHSQRTHPDAHEGTQGWEKMSWENIAQPAA